MKGFDGGQLTIALEREFDAIGIQAHPDKFGNSNVWLSPAQARRFAASLLRAAKNQERARRAGRKLISRTDSTEEVR